MRFPLHKYSVAPKAERTWQGKTYGSKAEMLYSQLLNTLLLSGELLEIIEQPRLWLGVPENVYVPDFLVVPKTTLPHYVDVKGSETAKFKRDKKLWASYGRLDLHVVKRQNRGFKTTEIIKGSVQ
jgi:hypothetical protein